MPRNMDEVDRKFYKKKMKAIKQALEEGDEAKADRHAAEMMNYFDV